MTQIDLKIMPSRQLAYFRINGVLTTRAGEQAFIAYTQHPDFDTRHTLLTNTLGMTGVDANFLQIMGAIIRLRGVFGLYRNEVLSVIHTNSETAFGVGRILQQVAEPMTNFRFVITSSESEALAKAGQTENTFDAFEAQAESGATTILPLSDGNHLAGKLRD